MMRQTATFTLPIALMPPVLPGQPPGWTGVLPMPSPGQLTKIPASIPLLTARPGPGIARSAIMMWQTSPFSLPIVLMPPVLPGQPPGWTGVLPMPSPGQLTKVPASITLWTARPGPGIARSAIMILQTATFTLPTALMPPVLPGQPPNLTEAAQAMLSPGRLTKLPALIPLWTARPGPGIARSAIMILQTATFTLPTALMPPVLPGQPPNLTETAQ